MHIEADAKGRNLELRYFRDVDGREVDFVVFEARKPIQFVECKWTDAEIVQPLRYLMRRFPGCSAWLIACVGTKDYLSPEGIRVAPAVVFLQALV